MAPGRRHGQPRRELPVRELPVAAAVSALLSGRADAVPADVLTEASPGLRLALRRLMERSSRRRLRWVTGRPGAGSRG
jgi:hypothetical protein